MNPNMQEQVQAARTLSPAILAISKALAAGLEDTVRYISAAPSPDLGNILLAHSVLVLIRDYGQEDTFWLSVMKTLNAEDALPEQTLPVQNEQVRQLERDGTLTLVTEPLVKVKRTRTAKPMDPAARLLRQTFRTEATRYLDATSSMNVVLLGKLHQRGFSLTPAALNVLLRESESERKVRHSNTELRELIGAVKDLMSGHVTRKAAMASVPAPLIAGELATTPDFKAEVPAPVVVAPVVAPVKPEPVKSSLRVRTVKEFMEARGRNQKVTQSEIARLLDISIGAVHGVMRDVRGASHIGGGAFILR